MDGRRSFLTAIPGVAFGAAGLAAAQTANAAGGITTTVAASNAPQSVQDAADFVCNGNADQVTINAAIDSISSLGGTVVLSPGDYICTGVIRTRKRVSLVGSGRSTRLVANFDGVAVIVSRSGAEDKMEVAHLAIIGQNRQVGGIFWNITSSAGFDEDAQDVANRISDVYISNVRRSGIFLGGTANRSAMVQRVRVLGAGFYGLQIGCSLSLIHI